MMWIRTSSVLLATLVVSGLSFPHPDDHEYKIPSVGTGQRSQYYVLHKDGTYKYGFDTGDGAYESVKSHTLGSLDGKFGYVDPDGNTIKLEYEAGRGGFVARGDHLPKPSPELAQALAAVVKRTEPFVDPLAGGDSDASYGFKFQSEDHSRTEKADSDGTVTGSYSYTDENGVLRRFTYRAGKGIGFVIEGDGLTQDVSAPTFKHSVHTAGPTDKVRELATPELTYTRTNQRSSVRATSEGDIPVIVTRSENPGDGSYSFSYNAGDHSRSETSDADLNVQGHFSFLADDGNQRTVNYVAGSNTGFVAEGDHLPQSPIDSEHAVPIKTSLKSNGALQRPTSSSRGYSHSSGSRSSQRDSPFPSNGPNEEANIRSSSSPHGSYSFSYDTSSHSRSESGDSNNNVLGKFDFIAEDDGEKREIKYEAGTATGFIAEGSHIPVGPAVPGAPSGQPTGRIVPVVQVPFIDPLADSDSDASYNFKFDSDTYSRSETADEDGNVVGTYTVVDDDGTRVTYRFRAGKGIGFETEEISRSQGPRPIKPVPYSGPLASDFPATSEKIDHSISGIISKPQQIHHNQHQTASSGVRSSETSSGNAASYFKQSDSSFAAAPSLKHAGNVRSTQHEFPEFTLNTYPASPDADKFGYVLRFQ